MFAGKYNFSPSIFVFVIQINVFTAVFGMANFVELRYFWCDFQTLYAQLELIDFFFSDVAKLTHSHKRRSLIFYGQHNANKGTFQDLRTVKTRDPHYDERLVSFGSSQKI